jgi:hemerythrin-like metal-binding protein
MPFIEWNENFKLGIEQFDEHHQHLVALINKVYDDYTAEAPSEAVGAVLDELVKYATYHFGLEEKWMDVQKYPNRYRHSEEHEKFSKTVTEMFSEYNGGRLNLSLDILIFLKNWLTDHILKTDVEYAHYVASKGVDISLV